MNTALSIPNPTINAAHNIARAAQLLISKETGMRMTVVLYPEKTKNPQNLLYIIAASQGLGADSFTCKTRSRHVVDLRFLGALLLRRYFPEIRVKQIGKLFQQDHTSVINAIKKASQLLETNDLLFTAKYHKAVNNINRWIKEV